ncbi:hypothetical protein BPAE_0086g00190 [Botrytis paeoniae]|uniref:Uncharacterized protein n=1 Tax=Botrytis paeoniae TaxID=278948 RepID=A0A4Z1FK40_9HELO|nr:hypothetical protein BPAE_0086g00190 [Botrytis paeoniae]
MSSIQTNNTPTTKIQCATLHSTSPKIGKTAGILLAIVGLNRSSLKHQVGKDEEKERSVEGDGQGQKRKEGDGGEENCRHGWMRYKMVGAGGLLKMEPGLDYGALFRCEMCVG